MKGFLFCIYFFAISLAFSQEQFDPSYQIDLSYYYFNEGNSFLKRIVLTNETVSFLDEEYSNEMETYQIQWVNEYRNKYIVFNYTGKSLGNKVNHGTKKYLVLFDSYRSYYGWLNGKNARNIALYDNNNKSIFSIVGHPYPKLHYSVTATSEFEEKNTTYEARNILDVSHLKPWAEGAQGNGAGEKITAVIDKDYYEYDINAPIDINAPLRQFFLIISNGFVDYNRPYLYEYNNRIKRLRIYYDDNREDCITIVLEDSPDFQFFDLYHNDHYGKNITIEIDEVYPGSRYNDTCINYLQIFNGK
jgi:hypothetical protein